MVSNWKMIISPLYGEITKKLQQKKFRKLEYGLRTLRGDMCCRHVINTTKCFPEYQGGGNDSTRVLRVLEVTRTTKDLATTCVVRVCVSLFWNFNLGIFHDVPEEEFIINLWRWRFRAGRKRLLHPSRKKKHEWDTSSEIENNTDVR